MCLLMMASCTTVNKSMREPNVRVNLNKSDFALSGQVTGEAKSTKFLGIDFARLFTKRTAEIENDNPVSLASVPVIGNFVSDRTANYALYEMMSQNPGYDVVIYPQYETKIVRPFLGLGFILKTTTVKATARLGKLVK